MRAQLPHDPNAPPQAGGGENVETCERGDAGRASAAGCGAARARRRSGRAARRAEGELRQAARGPGSCFAVAGLRGARALGLREVSRRGGADIARGRSDDDQDSRGRLRRRPARPRGGSLLGAGAGGKSPGERYHRRYRYRCLDNASWTVPGTGSREAAAARSRSRAVPAARAHPKACPCLPACRPAPPPQLPARRPRRWCRPMPTSSPTSSRGSCSRRFGSRRSSRGRRSRTTRSKATVPLPDADRAAHRWLRSPRLQARSRTRWRRSLSAGHHRFPRSLRRSPHVHSHVQFQSQSRDAGLPISDEVDVTFPEQSSARYHSHSTDLDLELSRIDTAYCRRDTAESLGDVGKASIGFAASTSSAGARSGIGRPPHHPQAHSAADGAVSSGAQDADR